MAERAQITMTIQQARDLETRGVKFKPATLSQTMGPNWREIVWLTSPAAPNLGKKCYVCDTHSVTDLRRMVDGLPDRLDIWHVQVTNRETGEVKEYLFKSATSVIISGQRAWHRLRGASKHVTETTIEFFDNEKNVLLSAKRIRGDVLDDPIAL